MENSEPVEGVDRSEVLSLMLDELPWKVLKTCLQANADLQKLCTLGGHRLDPKRRKRIEKILVKEAEKAEFSPSFCNGIFAQWYPIHEKLHKALEDHFHSDEYKAYRGEHELDEDSYVLTDEKFAEYFRVPDIEKWRALLCFSPLKFTDEQSKRILGDSEDNADLLRRMREVEEELGDLKKEYARQANETASIRKQYEQAAADVQELRKSRKALATERDSLAAKFERSQADNKKLRADSAETQSAMQEKQRAAAAAARHDKKQQDNDIKRQEKELATWQLKYEEQHAEGRRLQDELDATEAKLNQERATIVERDAEIAQLGSFGDLILSRIEWPEVGRQLKLTGNLKKLFNSLVRKLNYEEDLTLTIDGTLPEFWERLMSRENELINSVAQSNTLEVMNGDVSEYWRDLTDAFEDVHIGLEARTILLRLIQEIFYQVIDMGDLDKPTLHLSKPKSRAKST